MASSDMYITRLREGSSCHLGEETLFIPLGTNYVSSAGSRVFAPHCFVLFSILRFD